MKSVGAFEAKTHFSEILAKVAKGEQYVITKHGHMIAMIIPMEANISISISDAITGIKKLRKQIARKGISASEILSMRDKDRR